MMSEFYSIRVFLVSVILTAASLVEAEEMSAKLALGVSFTDGNSETLQANGSLIAKGEKEGLGSARYGIEASYGESTVDDVKEATVDNAKLFGNVKRTLSEKTFVYLDASALKDDIALVDYRATLGTGLGVYFVKSDDTKFFTEVGLSYLWEDVDDVRDDYIVLRVSQTYEYKLNETSRIWESAEYLPQINELNNSLLTAEIGAEAALNSIMNLRVVVQNKYDNIPAERRERNDLSLIAGISVNL